MVDFTIGVDPEIFVKENDKAISAHGLVKGTKESPFPIKDGAYQVDGMALEFNTDPVPLFGAGCFDSFNTKIVSVMEQLRTAAKEANPNVSFSLVPVQDFSKKVLDAAPDEAKELGCNPDYNAYTGKMNPRPDGDEVTFRTASGHAHVGWGAGIPADHPDHIQICCEFVKMLDITAGMFMTIIDNDPRRRVLYGRAGAFRPKSYGVEYRTPSNLWLKNTNRRNLFHRSIQRAVGLSQSQITQKNFELSEDEVQQIINEGDYIKAYSVFRKTMLGFLSRDQRNIVVGIFTERCKEEGKSDEEISAIVDEGGKSKEGFKTVSAGSYIKWL